MAGGTPQYEENWKQVPAEFHNVPHKMTQWGAILTLILYEIRQGAENIDNLIFDDLKCLIIF